MGAPKGRPQKHRPASYDPTSGLPYRPGPSFGPEEAGKLVDAANAMGISTSEVLNELVRRMPIDKRTGCPNWADEYQLSQHHPGQVELKLMAG